MRTEPIVTKFDVDDRAATRGLGRLERRHARFERSVSMRLDKFDRRWERSARSVSRFGDAMKIAFGAAGLVALKNYADAFANVERAMLSVGFTADGMSDRLFDLALRLRISATDTANAMRRLAKSTGADFETTARRVETLLKLMTIGGATQAERSAIGVQLGQALQSGVLSGDEFRTIREAAPVEFLQALAREAGVTMRELKATAEAQLLTSDVVLRALDSLSTIADEKFAQFGATVSEAFTVFETGLVRFVGSLDDGLGASDALTSALEGMGRFLNDSSEAARQLGEALAIVAQAAAAVAGVRGVQSLAGMLRDQAAARRESVVAARQEVAASVATEARLRQEMAARSQKVRGLIESGAATSRVETAQRSYTASVERHRAASDAVGAATAQLAAAQGRLSAATRVTTGAMRALRGAMAFFGGPIGLAITAAVTAMAAFQAHSRAAAAELERLSKGGAALQPQIYALRDAAEAYAAAIRGTADAQVAATGEIVAETRREFELKKRLLAIEIERRRQDQAARVSARPTLEAQLAEAERQVGVQARRRFRGPGRDRHRQAAVEAARKEVRRVEALLAEFDANAELAAIEIARAAELLDLDYGDVIARTGSPAPVDAQPTVIAPVAAAAPSLRRARREMNLPGDQIIAEMARARDLLRDLRTEEEALADERARLAALEPALIAVLMQEAAARGEAITRAEAEALAKEKLAAANARLVESGEDLDDFQARDVFEDLSRGMLEAIRRGESFADVLTRIGERLLDLAATGAIDGLFRDSGAFDSASSAVGGVLGGILGFSGGGYVRGPGGPKDDRILARLSDGEFVANAAATRKYRPFLEAMNAGRLPAFAGGGLVGMPMTLPPQPSPPRVMAAPAPIAISPVINVQVDASSTDDPREQGRLIGRMTELAVQDGIARALRPGGSIYEAQRGRR